MSSILKVDTIQDQDGNNIINESANTITIGASGDTITIPSGATLANSGIITGFESTGIDDNATSTAITIDSSQRVGIGTSNAQEKLNVIGSIRGDGLAGDPNYGFVFKARYDGATPLELQGNLSGGGWGIQNFLDWGENGLRLFAPFKAGTNTPMIFSTSGSERMRIDSAGNVGIGTSAPLAPLMVLTNNPTDDSALRVAVFGLSNVNQGQLEIKSGRDDGSLLGRYSSIQAWSNQLASPRNLILEPEGGNVGIGTTTPTYPLSVVSDALIAASITCTGATPNLGLDISKAQDSGDLGHWDALQINGNDNISYESRIKFVFDSISGGSIIAGFRESGSGTQLRFYTTTAEVATEKMRITSAGNVGIGTSSPAVSLDINNTDSIKIPVGTTAQRPVSPANGMVRFNSDLDDYEVYNSPNWETLLTNNNYPVEYLVIAGGGGGGQGFAGSNYSGSGGGAGGYRCSVPGENSGGGASAEPLLVIREGQSYTVTVGAGGAGGFMNATPSLVVATKGNDSVFGSITSIGGGRGISVASGNGAETNGGSGGGANYVGSGAVDGGGGSGTAGQGFAGGQAQVNQGGGGGGAGSIGKSVNGSPARGGGAGVASSITGSSVTRAVGGGGSGINSPGANTTGNGSGGAAKQSNGTTGNGTGQSGQAGIVIVRYLGARRGSGGTVSTSGDYTIHTFTSSGTYTG
jgi:hypothetical protein